MQNGEKRGFLIEFTIRHRPDIHICARVLYHVSLLTDLLTKPCGIPCGWTAEIAETGGGGPACGGGTLVGAWAPALCGASCGVVL